MCEDKGSVVQPQGPPAWLHLQEDLAQLAEESSDFVSLRGKLTKSSITNVLPWGHHSPYPWLPCHNTLYHTPTRLLPTESSAVPQCAGALTLLQSLSQLPALFLSVAVSSVSQSEHNCLRPSGKQFGPQIWAVQEQELPGQQDNPTATSGTAKLTAIPGTRGLSAILLHRSSNEHSALGVWGSNCFRGSTVALCFFGRPWKNLGTHNQTNHSFGLNAFRPKSLWESPKEWELLPLLLQLASQFPQNIQRYHLKIVFQLPPYLQGRKSPGKAAALNMEMQSLWWKCCSQPAPCLSHTSHQNLLSNYQSKIRSVPLYFGSHVTNFSTVPKTIFFLNLMHAKHLQHEHDSCWDFGWCLFLKIEKWVQVNQRWNCILTCWKSKLGQKLISPVSDYLSE